MRENGWEFYEEVTAWLYNHNTTMTEEAGPLNRYPLLHACCRQLPVMESQSVVTKLLAKPAI